MHTLDAGLKVDTHNNYMHHSGSQRHRVGEKQGGVNSPNEAESSRYVAAWHCEAVNQTLKELLMKE